MRSNWSKIMSERPKNPEGPDEQHHPRNEPGVEPAIDFVASHLANLPLRPSDVMRKAEAISLRDAPSLVAVSLPLPPP